MANKNNTGLIIGGLLLGAGALYLLSSSKAKPAHIPAPPKGTNPTDYLNMIKSGVQNGGDLVSAIEKAWQQLTGHGAPSQSGKGGGGAGAGMSAGGGGGSSSGGNGRPNSGNQQGQQSNSDSNELTDQYGNTVFVDTTEPPSYYVLDQDGNPVYTDDNGERLDGVNTDPSQGSEGVDNAFLTDNGDGTYTDGFGDIVDEYGNLINEYTQTDVPAPTAVDGLTDNGDGTYTDADGYTVDSNGDYVTDSSGNYADDNSWMSDWSGLDDSSISGHITYPIYSVGRHILN
jgi:hypothetical protein